MAKFVIAGVYDCPRFAMVEEVTNFLEKNLPNFKVHKILKNENDYYEWLKCICNQNGWDYDSSPIIWRELVERGSKGLLIDSAAEFLEYVETYYGNPLDYTTQHLLSCALDNKREFLERLSHDETLRSSIDVMHVCVMPACTKLAQMLLLELTNGRILFGKCQWEACAEELAQLRFQKQMVVHIYCHPGHEQQLSHLRDEIFSLSRPMVKDVIVAHELSDAFQDCSLVVFVEEKPQVISKDKETTILDLLSLNDNIQGYLGLLSSLRSSYYLHRDAQPRRKISKRVCFLKKKGSNILPIKPVKKEDDSEKKQRSLSITTIPAMDTLNMSIDELLSFAPILDMDEKKLHKLFLQTTMFFKKWQRIVEFGDAIVKNAKPNCKIMYMGDADLNFLAFVLAHNFPELSKNIITVTDLENRARGLMASKLEILLHEVQHIFIWGDPNDTFFVDVSNAYVKNIDGPIWKAQGFRQPLKDVFPYWKWLQKDFKKELKDFKEHYEKLKSENKAVFPLINNAVAVLEKWLCPEYLGEESYTPVSSVGVCSDGLYDIPEDFVLTCPVNLCSGRWRPLPQETLYPVVKEKLQRITEKCLRMQYLYKLSDYIFERAGVFDVEWEEMIMKITSAGQVQVEIEMDVWHETEAQDPKTSEPGPKFLDIRKREEYYRRDSVI